MNNEANSEAKTSFFLWRAIIGKSSKIGLKHEEYIQILHAWEAIAIISEIEEVWDSIIQSYIEFENELLTSAVHSMVLDSDSYDEFHDARLGFSRRVSNLLQACRSYLDQTPHYLRKLNIDGLKDAFNKQGKRAYDADFSYRFMEALRNHSQHRGVPMHNASFNARWVQKGSEIQDLLVYSVSGSVDLKKIRNDEKFNKNVLSEIPVDTLYMDVATQVRGYLEGLSGVHVELRKLLGDNLRAWKALIRATIKRYSDANDGIVIGLSVAEFSSDDDDIVVGYTYIFEELPRRVEKITRRNGTLVNLRRRYVSSEIVPPKQFKPHN